MNHRLLHIAIAISGLLMAIGCSNKKTPVPGAACLLNTDCLDPLSCNFGKCHEACRADGDCPGGKHCVWAVPPEDGSTTPSMRVCLEDPRCALDSTCPDPLVCGRDLECRNECESDRDCASEKDRCVPSGVPNVKVCAEPDAIDPNTGEVETNPDAGAGGPGSGGVTGGAGASGDGGMSGGGGTTAGRGGTSGGGGASGSGGGASGRGGASGGGGATAGGGGTSGGGVSGAGGAGVDAGPDSAVDGGPLVVTETEPNNDRDHAITYTIGTQVAGTSSMSDVDFYALTVPTTDVSGGYYKASLTDVGTSGTVRLSVYSTTDMGVIGGADGAGNGQSTFYFWPGSPGQTYHVRVYQYGNTTATFPYTLTITYTKIDDPYEPNDDRDTPRPIPLGTLTAYFFAGFVSSGDFGIFDDWYSVDFAAGATTIALRNIFTNGQLRWDVYDSTNANIKSGAVSCCGTDVSGTFNITTAGKYRIKVGAFSLNTNPLRGISTTMPDNFTRPYTMSVTQP